MRTERSLAADALLLVSSWIWLLTTPVTLAFLGRDGATLLALGAPAALLLVARRPAPSRTVPSQLASGIASGLALAAGYLAWPAWAASVAFVGLALGLAPREASPPQAAGALLALAAVVAAPVFEELLYRERLLATLCRSLGEAPAVLLSSLLFALPHLDAWNVLGAFLFGLGLGTLFLRFGCVAPCVATHAGINLASLLCGAPPVAWALSAWASAASGLLALGLARVVLRGAALRGSARGRDRS